MRQMDEQDRKSEFVEAGQDFIRKMDQLFHDRPKNNLLQTMDSFFQQNGFSSRLAVDVFETETEWVVQADLPGVKKNAIHIDIFGDRLKIRVEYKEETEKSNTSKNYVQRERKYKYAERTVQLPYVIDKKTTHASFQNGVLDIRGPKQTKTNNNLEIN